MSKRRRSLAATKGKDISRRAKPLVAGVGYMRLTKTLSKWWQSQ